MATVRMWGGRPPPANPYTHPWASVTAARATVRLRMAPRGRIEGHRRVCRLDCEDECRAVSGKAHLTPNRKPVWAESCVGGGGDAPLPQLGQQPGAGSAHVTDIERVRTLNLAPGAAARAVARRRGRSGPGRRRN